MTDQNLPIERGQCCTKGGSCCKLDVYDWLHDVKSIADSDNIVEIRFKNTRKDYFKNVNNLNLKAGDIVAVEANPGHDIGIVSLVGELVRIQMKKHKVTVINGELRKIYRKAKPVDIEKWQESISLEHQTMIKSRQIAAELKLDMKIGDVEYQGDKTKAIFYYIAEGRVDFRQLIKVLADTFHIRVEMKQIGARQEAGRIGGIGPCGRELCCATWVGNFVSVTTHSARYQEISLNPQKLAGQCGKLKCCLNFEVDSYVDAQGEFPSSNIILETVDAQYRYVKADIFSQVLYYQSGQESPVSLSLSRVNEIIRLNKKGKKAERLIETVKEKSLEPSAGYNDILSPDGLTRFDSPKKNRSRKKKRHGRKDSGNNKTQ